MTADKENFKSSGYDMQHSYQYGHTFWRFCGNIDRDVSKIEESLYRFNSGYSWDTKQNRKDMLNYSFPLNNIDPECNASIFEARVIEAFQAGKLKQREVHALMAWLAFLCATNQPKDGCRKTSLLKTAGSQLYKADCNSIRDREFQDYILTIPGKNGSNFFGLLPGECHLGYLIHSMLAKCVWFSKEKHIRRAERYWQYGVENYPDKFSS